MTERILILILALLNMGMSALCVPAFPNKVKVATEFGDSIEILIRGDEHNKYALSMDGYMLVPKGKTWYYLAKDINSEYVVSDVKIGSSVTEAQKRGLTFVNSIPSYNKMCSTPRKLSYKKRQNAKQESLSGTNHALVILMAFKDKDFVKSKQEITDLFNEIGYNADGARGSVRDFYAYASYGQFDLVCDVYGPFVAEHSMDFYGENGPNGSDYNPLALASEAIDNLPNDIDLSRYDSNSDGIVDNVHIIFAGYGEEAGAQSFAIWSHEYPYELAVRKNGYRFAGYSCTPELRSNFGKGISRIGVICHELGHAFGANDYYDVDYESNGSYDGTGEWDIMASGSWNDNGVSPANFNPYVKAVDFGWVEPISPQDNGNLNLKPYNSSPSVIRMSTANPDDYYLLEYRQKQSFDNGLPGEGVLIYHVHPLIESRRVSNDINSRHPQCLYPVCASSSVSPFDTSNYGDINSAGCPFPGISGNTEFSASSTPGAFLWNGESPAFSLKDIKLYDDFASIYIDLDGTVSDDSIINGPANKLKIYTENFENGLQNFFVESIEGDARWSIYPTHTISSLNDMPEPYEAKHALMLYNGKKVYRPSISSITSGKIILNPDSSYSISFWMRTIEAQKEGYQKFCFLLKDDANLLWEKVYENSDTISNWREIVIQVPSATQNLYYQLTGEILNSGIFIDDINVTNTTSANIIDIDSDNNDIELIYNPFSIISRGFLSLSIYDLSGKLIMSQNVSPNDIVTPNIDKGLYIICTDKGERRKVIIP